MQAKRAMKTNHQLRPLVQISILLSLKHVPVCCFDCLFVVVFCFLFLSLLCCVEIVCVADLDALLKLACSLPDKVENEDTRADAHKDR